MAWAWADRNRRTGWVGFANVAVAADRGARAHMLCRTTPVARLQKHLTRRAFYPGKAAVPRAGWLCKGSVSLEVQMVWPVGA
ncbi:hypothetical protein Micbo1qcDRAFT_169849 [Microdochium bolleyi]|uniref:Uncharacterized protein n=1 Tax=Microdochium bolleyi TaxID=196109 RepID=A0A136IIV5_9PEZI|nr:hypothetical protein Micbo1qcDRAFT_169849 [Microdochium bolleyi]